MDRDQLAERNRKLAAARHRRSWREYLRLFLLRAFAALPMPAVQKPENGTFLLIRPDQLGDMLLTLPAIQMLRRARPSARLIGLAGPGAAEAMGALPEIDLVLTVPFPGFARRGESLIAPYRHAWEWARQIRQLHVETAIILRPDHWWGALLAHMAGIPHRVGFDLPEVRPFLTEHIAYAESHSALQSLKLVAPWTGEPAPASAAALRLDFPIHAEDRAYIDGLLDNPDKPIVVIHPGASTPLKFWAPEHWAMAADRVAERLGALVILTGSDREHGQVWQIMNRMRREARSLVGETNVGQLAALYARARVVIGPDTGPLHLAVASGAPTVHLFGAADPALFGPVGDPTRQIALTSDIACRPCRVLDWSGDDPANHPCIREITPTRVIEAALQAAARPR